MEGNIGKKRTDRAAGRASSHSTSLSCNKSVVPDWLNTYLPHNYSLPSKSPVCLCARYIKHICHGSPSPSPLVATAHALFLTFMMEDGWMKKGPPSTKKKSTLRCDMGQRPRRQQNVVIKSFHQSQLLLSVPSLWSLFLYQDINFFFLIVKEAYLRLKVCFLRSRQDVCRCDVQVQENLPKGRPVPGLTVPVKR